MGDNGSIRAPYGDRDIPKELVDATRRYGRGAREVFDVMDRLLDEFLAEKAAKGER